MGCGKMKASNEIDNLVKLSGYVTDISCEVCGYEGKPDSSDGRCPYCSALGGIRPKQPQGRGREDGIHSNEAKLNRLFEELNNARLNGMEYY